MIRALEKGKIIEIITKRIQQKQLKKKGLGKQLAQERFKYPVLTVSQVTFFLNKFKNGDVNDIKHRYSLINTFERTIYLFEDKMTILYNVQDSQSSVPLTPNGSYKDAMVEQRNPNMNRFYFLDGFGVTVCLSNNLI